MTQLESLALDLSDLTWTMSPILREGRTTGLFLEAYLDEGRWEDFLFSNWDCDISDILLDVGA